MKLKTRLVHCGVSGNPTRHACEELITDIEGGVRGFAFNSGMSAITAVIMLFKQGDHLVIDNNIYGGTLHILKNVFIRFGIEVTYVETSQTDLVSKAIQENTVAIFVETPSSPLLHIADIPELAKLCRQKQLLFIVDNTMMTPILQNPLCLGADIVIHSDTKYLGGHSDVLAGIVVVNDMDVGEQLEHIQHSMGGILNTNDAWLLLRGMKTLGVRMQVHEDNTQEIAYFLKGRKDIHAIYYPGLQTAAGHHIHIKQAHGNGGIISIDLGYPERAKQFISRLHYFTLSENLASVESLISVPYHMSHFNSSGGKRKKQDIHEGILRLSIGLEDKEDLINDLDNAL